MRKEKNSTETNERHETVMKVVDTSSDQSQIEMEIERQVKSIRALIKRLRPHERQRYYDGLLSHILSQPVEIPGKKSNMNDNYDYCNLSFNELSLIREMSVKIHELYRLSEGDAHT